MKNYQSFFLSENFQFLELNFSIYLNRRGFVMRNSRHNVHFTLLNAPIICTEIVQIHEQLLLLHKLMLDKTKVR